MTGGTIGANGGGAGLQTHDTTFTIVASGPTATIASRMEALSGAITFDVANGGADPDLDVTGDIGGASAVVKKTPGTCRYSGRQILQRDHATLTGAC